MSTHPSERIESAALLTPAGLRDAVVALLGNDCADLDDAEDLIGAGLDSIGIMRLANRLIGAGAEVTAAELMDEPTLGAWLELVGAGGSADDADDACHAAPEELANIAVPEEIARIAAPEKLANIAALEECANIAAPGLSSKAGEPFPLATMQHAYWVGRMGGHPLSVASHFYCEFDSAHLDAGRLEHAARLLTRRHPMLRAQFLEDGRQQILPSSPWPGVTRHDLSGAGAEDAARTLRAVRDRESHRRMAVDSGEVFDIQVSCLPDGRCRLHVNVDMLVADAWSFRILLGELARLYADPDVELPPLAYDTARYQRDTAAEGEQAAEQASAYWRDRLDTLPAAPQLPLAVDPAALKAPRVGRREHWLSEAEYTRLRELCREHRVTVAMALAAAFADVVGRWSVDQRFLLNLPLFDRRPVHPDVTGLIGDFTGLLLLAVDGTDQAAFAEQARRLQESFRADVRHAAYPGVAVLRDLARRRPGTMPSAPVVFTSALGLGDLFGPDVRAQFGSLTWMISQTAQVWLDHQATEDDGRLLLNWDAVEPLFPAGCLDAMFEAYVAAIRWLLDPDSDWSDPLPAALPTAQARTRARVNDTATPVPSVALFEPFLACAEAAPERLALAWCDDSTMTYGELAGCARGLALQLLESGVRPSEPVAVTLPKGPAQVIAVLGVLMAGCCYVPVGVDQPAARRDHVYAAAGVRLVISDDDLPDPPEGIDQVVFGAPAAPGEGELPKVSGDQPAYLLFTSGSTGTPKGVLIPHAAAVNTVTDINTRCGIGPQDRILAVSALDFDLSVYDLFGVLSVGGAAVLINEEERRDARRWLDLVRWWDVTLWQTVPALLDMLLMAAEADDESAGGLGALRWALVGGDWPGLDLAGRLAVQAPGSRLAALGGTTETAIHSTWYQVDRLPPDWVSVPWGTPLGNVRCRVVDGLGRDRPDWVPGELWIGGASVALGYHGDAERTRRQFVEHDGTRWYRTGDIARYRPDGLLEFLGRDDHQVKIRGHRIELGEVEAACHACPGVERAVAVGIGERGRRQLAVAVSVAAGDGGGEGAGAGGADSAGTGGGGAGAGGAGSSGANGAGSARSSGAGDTDIRHLVARLRAVLAERLPSYMIPEHVAVLTDLPLSPNGKIDRAAIARLLAERRPVGSGAAAPPAGPVEQALSEIWSRLLDVADVGRDQSFFTLGGDSLLATRFIQETRRATGWDISLRQLFDAPTIGELAAVVADRPDGVPMEEGVL
ncbi:amino acid adenylation domain-containing protein [Catenulispora sp. MAP12-49]|uniref:amino acid adenylation domain-containing protein n=1 Tax=Catenulispora sp. MAP12-49 TaxID=3156302 RepID=UPI003510E873